MNLFPIHFSVPINNVPGDKQMAIVDFHCNNDLKAKCNNVRLTSIPNILTDTNTFPAVHSHSLKTVSLSGTTYLCEDLFQGRKTLQPKKKNPNNQHSLRIAASQIKADTDRIICFVDRASMYNLVNKSQLGAPFCLTL